MAYTAALTSGWTPNQKVRWHNSLALWLIAPIPLALAVAVVLVWVVLPGVIADNSTNEAIRASQQIAAQFKTIRAYYTENVVNKIVKFGTLKPSFDHKGNDKSVPLPATFIHDLSELLAKKDTTISLYSRYPFPNRKERQLDPFQQQAWDYLNANPGSTFSRNEIRDGKQIVRVAVADTMAVQACVNCHNSSPVSPKTDWKLGDVRGVLEVTSMIDSQLAAGASLSNSIILSTLFIASVMLGISLLTARRVTKPLRGLSGAMGKLAAGNFDVALPGLGRKDEIGQISSAAQMVAKKIGATISNIVSNIKLSAGEVASASAELSASTTDLSQRTEEQSASLEQTSAMVDEISTTVKKNSEDAQQANQFATETHKVAEHGGVVVSDAVNAMAKIEESSRKISDIISVIDEIARQTNLLALNAAVEAARAGDAGRGFAVVPSEVRSLAQRSSQAAKDIKDLITNSSGQVKDGVELVNRAGTALNEIVESIRKVTKVVSNIASASVEQSASIDQIGKALAQMDEVTQQNSALVEENAATAKTLEQHAKTMDEQVASFGHSNGADNAEFTRATDAGERHPAATPRPEAAAPKRPLTTAAKRAAAASKHNGASRGPVGQMQTALATAVNSDLK